MKWIKTNRTVSLAGTTNTYHAVGTDYQVESRKRHIPHANGKPGTWDYTSYWVVRDGKDIIQKYSLKDAKEYVEKLTKTENV